MALSHRHDFRSEYGMVAGEQRDAVNDAGGRYEFISRVASEVQACRCAGNSQINGPDMQCVE